MAFTFEPGESVPDAAIRVIGEELDGAIGNLTDAIVDAPAEAVHTCRKQCKKIRAVARLVRPALGDAYGIVNQRARDAARELSDLRDAAALADTFDSYRDEGDSFDRAGDELHAKAEEAQGAVAPDLPAVQRALAELERLRDFLDTIEFETEGWDAIAKGLRRTYGRGHKALARAIDEPSPDHFHAWRKRVKYTRHHMELLGPAAPEILDPLESALHDLSDLLGDAHDLSVIGESLDDDFPVTAHLAEQQAEREARAIELGRHLYAESPKRFTQRLASYWTI